MATVRVSFLFAGERIHRRLNRHSVLSDVPAKATRVNRAGPGYKVIRLRGLSHTDNIARNRPVFPRRYGRGPVISLSPSASCATWPTRSSTGKHGCGPLPHCASSALPSPGHLLPTTLVFEAPHPHLATME